MATEFTFRTGKYAGKTLEEVAETNPAYLVWVRENRPEMLQATPPAPKQVKPQPRKEPTVDSIPTAMQPNLDFFKEGKQPEVKTDKPEEDEWNF